MRIYLDNNATAPMHPETVEALSDASRRWFGNPSSVHAEGQAARRALEESRERLAAALSVEPRRIVFTSGGTESNNAAILGLTTLGQRCHIVTTSIEHPSAGEAVRRAEEQGHPVTRVSPGPDGVTPAAAIIAALRQETGLVVMMLANNETGVLQPVAEVAEACRARGIRLHCDAVQALGRIPIDLGRLGAATAAFSAHKIHGPKGIGALYVREGLTLAPHLVGGAQERRRRAGTESVPLAVAFARALERIDEQSMLELEGLRDGLEAELTGRLGQGVVIHGREAGRLPNTISCRFPGVDAEALVIALDLAGVAISTGSACSSGRVEPSRVLLEMGLSEEDARSSVRISVGFLNTAEELQLAAGLIVDAVQRSRQSAPENDDDAPRKARVSG